MARSVTGKRGELRLSELADVCVLYPGDLREFGGFVLKAFAARDQVINARSRGSVQRSRPTLYGLVQDSRRSCRTSSIRTTCVRCWRRVDSICAPSSSATNVRRTGRQRHRRVTRHPIECFPGDLGAKYAAPKEATRRDA